MTETEAHQQPAKQPHPTDPRRWSDGTVRPGAALHLTHGAYAEGPRRAQLADRLGDLAGFRAALESDHGGADTLTTIRAGYVRRLTEVEGLCRLLGSDLVTRGIFTAKGRVRNTFGAFVTAVEKWDRLAQRLGLERRTRDLNDMSITDYLKTDQTDETNPASQTRTHSETRHGSTFAE